MSTPNPFRSDSHPELTRTISEIVGSRPAAATPPVRQPVGSGKYEPRTPPPKPGAKKPDKYDKYGDAGMPTKPAPTTPRVTEPLKT